MTQPDPGRAQASRLWDHFWCGLCDCHQVLRDQGLGHQRVLSGGNLNRGRFGGKKNLPSRKAALSACQQQHRTRRVNSHQNANHCTHACARTHTHTHARAKTQTTSTKLPPAQTEDYVSNLGTAIVKVPFSAHTKESRLLPAPLPPSPEGPTPAVLEVFFPQAGSLGGWRGSGKVIFLNRHAEICTGG